MTAGDYDAAATLVAAAPEGVDLIIADYRLPRVPNGARAAGRLRVLCRRSVPVLIVTADPGQEALPEVAKPGFPALQNPVNPDALRAAIDAQPAGSAFPRPVGARATPRHSDKHRHGNK